MKPLRHTANPRHAAHGAPRYAPPKWLPGGNAQTIWPLLIKGPLPPYRRQRWETPDGDFIDLDWIDAPPQSSPQACVVLFHGLEGSSRSHYARRLMHAVRQRGWNGVVVNFRGCSGEPNRLARAYHSGDSAEINWILRRLHAQGWPALFAAGVSLGANALLKWLAEQGEAANAVISAAAAVSAPLDLAAANRELSSGFNRMYSRHFLRTLIPNAQAKAKRFPGLFDMERARQSRTLGDFDDAVTAPLHGFSGADDYYARSSAGPLLGTISAPTLLLHADNDPFLPQSVFPLLDHRSSSVALEMSPGGGHVGFVHGELPGQIDWMPQRLLNFFSDNLRHAPFRLSE